MGRDDTERRRRQSGGTNMQIGVIGLGRMGANIVRRLQHGGHACVAYDMDAATVARLAAGGMATTGDLGNFVTQLAGPGGVWVMVPAGTPTEETVAKLGELLQRDDVVIDGGNSFYQDDVRRA